MGQDVAVYDNTIMGPWGPAVLYGWTSPAWQCYGNRWGADVKGWSGSPVVPEDHGTKPAPANLRDNLVLPAGAPTPPPPVPPAADGAITPAAVVAATQPATT